MTINVFFVGDIAFFSDGFDIEKLKNEIGMIKPFLNGDFNIGNFELPISIKKKPNFANSYSGYIAPLDSVEIIKELDFHVLSLSNNHIMDWGDESFRISKESIEKEKILTVGAGNNCNEARKEVIVNKDGIKLAFLGYCNEGPHTADKNKAGAASFRLKNVIEDIAKLKNKVDHVILLLHWGKEFCEYPYPPDRNAAKICIDKGANLIIGHHPHVVQGYEIYKNIPIFYSLGSFIYNTKYEKVKSTKKIDERNTSIGVNINFGKNKIIDWEIVPFFNNNDSLIPKPMTGNKKDKFLDKYEQLSQRLIDSDSWYHREAVENIIVRELVTILQTIIETRGKGVTRLKKYIKFKYIKELILYIIYRIISVRLKIK